MDIFQLGAFIIIEHEQIKRIYMHEVISGWVEGQTRRTQIHVHVMLFVNANMG